LHSYFGGGCEQNPFTQKNPCMLPQQSESFVHFSYSCAHPLGGGTHVSAPVGEGRQNPSQHSAPEVQVAPFCWHGSSAQNPRMFPAGCSCPGK
jgi:hypothetical protein